MKFRQTLYRKLHLITVLILTSITHIQSATVKDVFNLNPDGSLRVPRDNKYYIERRDNEGQRDISTSRLLKPEESPEARDSQSNTGIEKRCSRCDSYSDYRGGTPNYRTDYRYQDPRYDSRRYYDDRYESYDRYDTYDPYSDPSYDRDRYRRPSYNSRDDYYDRYEPRDRYPSSRDRTYEKPYERPYERPYEKPYERPYDRQYDRGIGYDNAGYDYRGSDSRYGYKPYDETYRGTSGWDSSGKGYYFNRGVPESAGKWGTYASSWGYGRDDRDRGYRDYGSTRGQYRPRDSFTYGTSYLYGRPSSSTTTSNPSISQDSDNSVTDTPNDTSSTG